MTGRRWSFVAVVCLGAAMAPNSARPEVIRLGGEFQVPSYTSGYQGAPDAAIGAGGSFVVVWHSTAQDGDGKGVFARRFAADGVAQAVEFQVAARTLGYQSHAVVDEDANGNFVVVWQSFLEDGSSYGLRARRFNASGAAQSVEFQVNSYTFSAQGLAAVAMNGAGGFVVAWTSYNQDGGLGGIFARRFDAAGAAQAIEFEVNALTLNPQDAASVAIDGDGDFVVVWRSYLQDGSEYGIFGRVFDASGLPHGNEFQVTTYTGGTQRSPAVAIDAGGDFLVVWESLGQDASNGGIFAQRFASSGAALDVEFQVNTVTAGRQKYPAVATSDDGAFVVAWQSQQDGDFYGVFARTFGANGSPQATELQINAYTPGFQIRPTVDRAGSGFVVAWNSYPDQDGSDSGVFAQRLKTVAVLDIDANGAVAPLTDGLLVLRFLFGFTNATLTTGAVASDCTRCDAASIAGYLDTLI